MESVQDTLLRIWGELVAHLPYLVAGLLVLLLTWAVAALFERFSGRLLDRWRFHGALRGSLRALITRLVVVLIWVAGLLTAAMIVFPGVTPTRALGALGLASIAIGFAFKDIFENFFAGILLLWRFPFETGDFVECEGIMGAVQTVTIRMTEIRRPTGELVVVPNSFLFKNPVTILTSRPRRRIAIVAGVAYGEDLARAVEVIRAAVTACETVDGREPVQIFPQGFGESSMDIEVAWWTDPTPLGERRSRAEVVTAVKRALDEAGVEIPFPYRTLTFKEPLSVRAGAGNGAGGSRNE